MPVFCAANNVHIPARNEIIMFLHKFLTAFGRYLQLMGRTFSRPEKMRMFFKQYRKEMEQLGVNSIAIVLLISFFIGAVICIQIKLNVQSPWMPHWTSGYVTREIMLLEFSSSIMCLILSGKVGSNMACNDNAVPCYFQHCVGHNRCIRNCIHRSYHIGRRSYRRNAAPVHTMVRMDGNNQITVLCVHHCERILLLRLHSGRRLAERRKSKYQRRSVEFYADTFLRFIPHTVTLLI